MKKLLKNTAKTIALIIISATLFSCSKHDTDIAPEFTAQVDNFINEAALRGKDWNPANMTFEIRFTHDLHLGASKVAGLATRKDGGKHADIQIDYAWWNRSTDEAREVIILHELGHGLLDFRHDVGSTIMGTNKVKYDVYVTDRTATLDDFFSYAK